MNSSNIPGENVTGQRKEMTQAQLLNRIVAKAIDFLIVAALYEIVPRIGYIAGLAYLLAADGMFQGRSIGKRLMGLKVIVPVDEITIKVCGARESIFRNLPFGIGFIVCSILGMIPAIGWLLLLVAAAAVLAFETLVMMGSEDGMRFGDEIAGTRVVDDIQGGTDVS